MLVLVRDVIASWTALPECRRGTVPTRGAAEEDGRLKEVVVLVVITGARARAWAGGVRATSAKGIVLTEGIPEEAFRARGRTRDGRNSGHGKGSGRKEGEGVDDRMYTGDRGEGRDRVRIQASLNPRGCKPPTTGHFVDNLV